MTLNHKQPSAPNVQDQAQDALPLKETRVWDLFVRVFHWSLLSLVALSYLSGEFDFEIHSYSGYAIFILVCLRIIWGFIGSKNARFKNFVYSPKNVVTYLKSIVTGNPKRFLGHNPAGGLMVLALLTVLGTTTLSGMKLYAIEEGEGPFASNVQISLMNQAYADSDEKEHSKKEDKHDEEDKEGEEFWEEVHETSINLLILLILLHVLGVVLASKQHKENLARAMITGNKTL
ncbi:MAG: cytochrome b [Glaciecola sp.]|jgi:cytochrome b